MADEVKERLEKRQKARLGELDRRRRERDEQTQPDEDPKALLTIFNKEKEMVEKMLEELDHVDKKLLSDYFEELSKKTLVLQKFLSDSLVFLPSYDVKKRQQEISKLEQDINEKRNYYLPKKKFAFRKKKSDKNGVASQANKDEVIHKIEVSNQDLSKSKEINESSEVVTSGQEIIRQQCDLLEKDVTFSKMKDSKITLFGSPSALRLEKLEGCTICCGPVSGSVFVNSCKDCTFVFPCQQLRVHTTVDSGFYLLVTSRAIIEDSHNLGFAEFDWSYPSLNNHFENSTLDRTKNNWSLVNDFNWLKTDKQSPNWYLLKDEDKVKSWN